ncbi:1654_t:CDS:2 [Dentiscutata heterogama]|uniref:1654_t:CDS:1 n=1 Tax=Dentiscutata heterogama TaxID=1316150 RepID=A0ACA9KPW6_9GLOM|nr:1654_t:CDS:2 [Dentiscutata heterogama]
MTRSYMNLWDDALNFTDNDNMKGRDKPVESNNNPQINDTLLNSSKQPMNSTHLLQTTMNPLARQQGSQLKTVSRAFETNNIVGTKRLAVVGAYLSGLAVFW